MSAKVGEEHALAEGWARAELRDTSGAELDPNESSFRQLVDVLPDILITINEQSTLVYINGAAERELGYRAAELVGKPLAQIMPARFRTPHRVAFRQFLRTGERKLTWHTIEFPFLHKSGREVMMTMALSELEADSGRLFLATARPVADRHPALERAHEQHRELQLANVRLRAMQDVTLAVGSSMDVRVMLQNVLEAITGLEDLPIQHRALGFVVKDEQLSLVAQIGGSECLALNLDSVPKGTCLCGRAAEQGEIIVSENSLTDDRHEYHAPDAGPHGHIVVPLKAGNRTVGVFCLYSGLDVAVDQPFLQTLRTIGQQVGMAIENARLYDEARTLSLHDSLTKLGNRRLMHIVLDRAFATARRTGRPFCVIMIDIDHFKAYNDTHGHAMGDRALQDIASAMSDSTREMDLVIRYGGEEFLVLLPDAPLAAGEAAAERIRSTVESRSDLTISLGVAGYDDTAGTSNIVVERADRALYEAKETGRNRVCVSRPS